MDRKIISQLRLYNQKITHSDLTSPADVVRRMGALQAQDFIMSKWAIGLRMQNSTEEMINREIDSGRIIRTHVLRPTWHIVSAEDVYWIIELSAPQIKALLSYRDKRLGLTAEIFLKANKIIVKSLEGNRHKTREELIPELKNAGIRVDENRASHIFLRAEIEGLVCSGKRVNNKPSYTLLEEWVPVKNTMKDREAALQELAIRYFETRGPATVRDFEWWSGLSLKDSKLALSMNKGHLQSRSVDGQEYWYNEVSFNEKHNANNLLLPAYDEFLISYRDRSAVMQTIENEQVVSKNGIFYPTILINGIVVGTWKRNLKNGIATIMLEPFTNETDLVAKLEKSIAGYSAFINRKIEVKSEM